MSCPQGAMCPGDERFTDLVNSTFGFWRTNFTVDSAEAGSFCDAPRRITRGECPAFQPCEPVEACAGNNTCVYGYEGPRCAQCLAGKFHRVGTYCQPCPENLPLLYAGLATVLLVFAGGAYFLNKKNVSLALISIGVGACANLSASLTSLHPRCCCLSPPDPPAHFSPGTLCSRLSPIPAPADPPCLLQTTSKSSPSLLARASGGPPSSLSSSTSSPSST